MVHLNQNHAVSVQRTAALMKDLFGLPESQATVLKAAMASAGILQATVEAIGQAAVSACVLHADEIGLRVARTLHWLHVLATDTLTWMGCHPKRGGEAFESLALLQQFKGVLVHDGWMPCKALQCQHALCNAHHLRELTYQPRRTDHRTPLRPVPLLLSCTPDPQRLPTKKRPAQAPTHKFGASSRCNAASGTPRRRAKSLS